MAGLEDGRAWVTLEVPPDVALYGLEPVDPENPDAAVVNANWELAVDKVVVGVEVDVSGGHFEAALEFDPDLPSTPLRLKAYVDDGLGDAVGAAVLP